MWISLLGLCLLRFATTVKASGFYCIGTCYKGDFSPTSDVQTNSALLGHSYRNISGITEQACFGSCINDCRCVSFQMRGSLCELLEEDRSTTAVDFQPAPGYNYYDLKQEFVQQDIDNCLNGCCRSNPCLNGGTCTELCDNVKTKFNCTCPDGYKGRVCETRSSYTSCLEVKTTDASASNGEYTIEDASGNTFKAYCDLNAEPDFVWTLIESFAYQHNSDFARANFKLDLPRDENIPNWIDYRLAKSTMEHIRQDSTHFRATCNFDKPSYNSSAEYLRGNLTTYDILAGSDISSTCILYERVSVAGSSCINCTAETWHGSRYHYHLEDDSCDLQGVLGYFSGSHREYFGYYGTGVNPENKCSDSPSSTTQYWLGIKL